MNHRLKTKKIIRNNHIKAQKALWFLEEHPAMGGGFHSPMETIHLRIVEVCKRGYVESVKKGVAVWYSAGNYRKFKEEFDQEFSTFSETEVKTDKNLTHINVPYKKLFHEEWKFDRIEYWGDLSFRLFTGNNFNLFHDQKNWISCQGVECSAGNFEDLMVKIAKEFKRKFGNFKCEDFLTLAERENHKSERLMLYKKEKNSRFTRLIRNLKYKFVRGSEFNRRWVKWFSKTQYCRKNWKSDINLILKGKGFS